MLKGKAMAAVINYHIHIRTSYSKDGFIILWCIDPQTGQQSMNKTREMTKREIRDNAKIRKGFEKKSWLNDEVLVNAGVELW